jgi:hypothetical protein
MTSPQEDLMRRIPVFLVVAGLVTACGGGAATPSLAPSVAPTQAAVATVLPTSAPTVAAVLTNPPPTPIPGCLPQCWQGRLTRPGAISGSYTTKNFFGGHLTVSVPDGWASREDSTGEFAVGRPNDESASIEFWIDVFAAKTPAGAKDETVAMDAPSMVDWFTSKKILTVIDRSPTTLDGIPAERIEYRRNAKAATEDPGCPSEIQPCSVAFSYPEWDGAFGEGGPFHSQLIVADAMWGGQRHAIYVMFWGDETSYPELIDQVNAVIASIHLPEGVGPAS